MRDLGRLQKEFIQQLFVHEVHLYMVRVKIVSLQLGLHAP